MSEITQTRHLGWFCNARSCEQVFYWRQELGFFQDREQSQAEAESAGWAFIRSRSLLSFCPEHAPAALTRAAKRRDKDIAQRARWDGAK